MGRALVQRQRIHAPRQRTCKLGVEYVDWRTHFKKRTGKTAGRNTAILELKMLSLAMGEAVRLGHTDANPPRQSEASPGAGSEEARTDGRRDCGNSRRFEIRTRGDAGGV